MGSLGLITGVRDLSGVGAGRPFPDWCEEPTDGELRDTEVRPLLSYLTFTS